MRELLKKGLEEIVREKDGDIIVDWKKFEDSKGGYNREVYNAIHQWLIEKNILSDGNPGDYGILNSNILINPFGFCSSLFFSREKDALEYKEQIYPNINYRVFLIKLEKELPKCL